MNHTSTHSRVMLLKKKEMNQRRHLPKEFLQSGSWTRQKVGRQIIFSKFCKDQKMPVQTIAKSTGLSKGNGGRQ
jgi:hypothetical protein